MSSVTPMRITTGMAMPWGLPVAGELYWLATNPTATSTAPQPTTASADLDPQGPHAEVVTLPCVGARGRW